MVTARLGPPDPPRFFTAEEEPAARALLDRLLAQDEDPRVPVFEVIDERLAERRGDGFRYEDLPDDPEAWRQSIAALNDTAHERLRTALRATGTQGATRHHRRGAAVRREHGMGCRPHASSHCGCATPAAPSTPIRGPGTRSASAVRRIRVATSTSLWAPASRGRSKSATREDPVPWAKRAEAAKRRHAEGLSSSDASRQGPDEDE